MAKGKGSAGRGHAPNGVILFEGKSEIDQQEIVAIATGFRRSSENSKTGWMLQTWILRADLPPTDAAAIGADRSVCGDCRLRAGGCYVTLHRAPRSIFSAYKRGLYPSVEQLGWSWLTGRAVRLGSYGDPAAVPAPIWYRIAARATRWTGYTRQWRTPSAQHLRFLLMASVDSPAEAFEARSLGWRSYRIRLPDEPLLPTESVCPASEEAGHRTTCERCGQCDGARLHDIRQNYAVIAHGSGTRAYERARLRIL